ncbi:Protein of unknown function, partial [Gryllus bimaculatus]
ETEVNAGAYSARRWTEADEQVEGAGEAQTAFPAELPTSRTSTWEAVVQLTEAVASSALRYITPATGKLIDTIYINTRDSSCLSSSQNAARTMKSVRKLVM